MKNQDLWTAIQEASRIWVVLPHAPDKSLFHQQVFDEINKRTPCNEPLPLTIYIWHEQSWPPESIRNLVAEPFVKQGLVAAIKFSAELENLRALYNAPTVIINPNLDERQWFELTVDGVFRHLSAEESTTRQTLLQDEVERLKKLE